LYLIRKGYGSASQKCRLERGKLILVLTMANPESKADVLLEAFSLARLSCSFLHDSCIGVCSPSPACDILACNKVALSDSLHQHSRQSCKSSTRSNQKRRRDKDRAAVHTRKQIISWCKSKRKKSALV
jgi:hypothetical protein